MKAVFGKEVQGAKNLGNEKETVDTKLVVVIHKGEIITPIIARWYMGRSNSASQVHCSIWVYGKKFYTSGHGTAGGWGYHKPSAAFDSALRDADVTLHGSPYDTQDDHPKDDRRKNISVSGCGDTSVDSALVAMTRALGYRGKVRIV